MSPKFTNKQFFTVLIVILIPTLIFFANIKSSFAAPLGADLTVSINSAFSSTDVIPLTKQQIIDNGCKKLTSELVQNVDNVALYLPADVLAQIKAHKAIVTTNQNKVLPILTGFQNQITNATAPIDYNVLNGFIDDVYDQLIDVTDPIQDSTNSLNDFFDKTSDVSAEVVDIELEYFIDNQNYSLDYIYNYIDTIQEDINNDLTKDNYTKAEAQLIFDDVKFNIEDEFLNMQDRHDETIAEFEDGLGTIKDVFVSADEECGFIIQDIIGQEFPLNIPIIKQYVCDSLYLATASNVQYIDGNCLVYK